MTVRELCSVVSSDDTIIALVGNCGWVGTFPCMYLPDCYSGYTVKRIRPDEDKGLFSDGMCIIVWMDEN